MSELNVLLGKRLRVLRVQKELSQEKLAEMANLNVTFIGLIERGRANPTVETLERLADALGISVIDFFAAEKPISFEASKNEKIKKLLSEYTKKLSDVIEEKNRK